MSFILSDGNGYGAVCSFRVSRRGACLRSSARVAQWTARTAGRTLVVLRGLKAGRRRGNSSHGLDFGLSTSEVRHSTRPSSRTQVVVSVVCGAWPLPATMWNTAELLKLLPLFLPLRALFVRHCRTREPERKLAANFARVDAQLVEFDVKACKKLLGGVVGDFWHVQLLVVSRIVKLLVARLQLDVVVRVAIPVPKRLFDVLRVVEAAHLPPQCLSCDAPV